MSKSKEQEKKSIFPLPRALAGFWWLVVIAAAFLIISVGMVYNNVDLEEGEYAKSNVYYFGTAVTYVSQEQTAAAKEMAEEEVEDVYKIDDMVIVNVHKAIDDLFDQLYTVRSDEGLDTARLETEIRQIFDENISNSAIDYYLGLSDWQISQTISSLKDQITDAYAQEITEDQTEEMKSELLETIMASDESAAAKAFSEAVINTLDFPPNKVVDEAATEQAVTAAVENVQPIQITVNPGQLIVRRGEEVTPTIMETLQAVGLISQSGHYQKYAGIFLLVLLSFLIIRAYCATLNFNEDKKERSIVVLTLLLLLTLLIGRLLTLITVSTTFSSDLMLGLLVPVPAFSLMSAILVNKRASILATVILSIFIGIMCNGHMLYVMAALLGGLVGIIETSKMDSRNKYLLIMLFISGTYCLSLLSWSLIWGYSLSYIAIGLIMCALNGVLSVILAIGTLPLLENLFGITTRLHLLELSNTNHPLLKQLMIEAPGTYNHSVLVGNLAEAAADAIGANGLLVRVASYFHDIGKVKRPYFFIENQRGNDNPHDKLQPSLSTFVITSHTKNGAELARKNKLPKEIIDIILQHHGTGLLVGFYNKAQQQTVARGGKAEDVRQEDFRYPGPVPQTKEAALVMLADSCQAAIMAMSNPTRGQIEGRVREVIKSKFNDGQLNECDLTFRDLEIIASVFVRVLAGVNHKRILYPDQIKKENAHRQAEEKKQKAVQQKLTVKKILAETHPDANFVEADAVELEKAVDLILAEKNLTKKGTAQPKANGEQTEDKAVLSPNPAAATDAPYPAAQTKDPTVKKQKKQTTNSAAQTATATSQTTKPEKQIPPKEAEQKEAKPKTGRNAPSADPMNTAPETVTSKESDNHHETDHR